MKESKFIELLNLYIDQQIEPADAALLEEEIMRTPSRRRVYQQYCRMHRACGMLLEQSRPTLEVGKNLAAALAAADTQILEFPQPQRNVGRWVYAGGLAAACAALVFVGLNREKVPSATATPLAVAEQVVQIGSTSNVAVASTSSNVVDGSKYQAVLVTHSARGGSGFADGAFVRPAGDRPSLDWVRQVQFTPVDASAPDFAFDLPSSLKSDAKDNQQVFRSKLPALSDAERAERAAFEFRR